MMTTVEPTDSGTPAIGWGEIGKLLDRSESNAAYRTAARWALDTLQARLGADWLERAVSRREEDFPLGLHLLSCHAHALAEGLEWALRLEMCESWEGSADFLRDLINDPSPGRILHSRNQLAQASFAARLGWPVSLEPVQDGGAPADLAIATPSGLIVTEVRVLTPSEFGRDQRTAAESASDWLFWLGRKHGVWIGGKLGRDPTKDERQEIEDLVKHEAGRAAEGSRPVYSVEGITLELGEWDVGGSALTSPPVREDLFDRMVRAIAEKAEKMQASGAQWLHASVLTGLWRFTEWGRGPLSSKAPFMSSALSSALGDRCPFGVVLTSGSGLAPDDMEEEVATSAAGISLRIPIQALRARETLILPFRPEATTSAKALLALARSESDWLGWALAEKNLPSLDEMLAVPST